jgi:CRP/FNR family transcriptional regulator, cyclic AMP receptor protein
MKDKSLGKVYPDGETIIRQGEVGNCMYVIQDGRVEVFVETIGRQIPVCTLDKNEFFGEMAIFEGEVRSATVLALGEARVLTIDKKNFLRGIHEDPSLAFRIVQTLSRRIRDLNEEIAGTSARDRRQDRRIPVSLPIDVAVNGGSVMGTLLELSHQGGMIETGQELPLGQRLVLTTPKIDRGIDAEVRHRRGPDRYGMRFSMPLQDWRGTTARVGIDKG